MSVTPHAPWPQAAAQLASRVNRRDRVGRTAQALALGLLGAAGVALLWRAFGPARLGGLDNTTVVLLLLALGLLVGALRARGARATTPRVGPADAAWALDRLAGARGRGLAAAAATGAAASEAAFAGEPLGAPPTVRMLPPRGLVLLAAGVLLGAVAGIVPARAADATVATPGTRATDAAAAATTAAAEEAEGEARRLDARVEAAQAAREALDLPTTGALDPARLRAQLADPETRTRAAEAARADPELAAALAEAGDAGAGLAGLLDPSEDNRERAAEQRRQAAAARAGAVGPSVPADRRDLVARYFDQID